MAEKRMVILPAELVRRIDENRGDLSQAQFVEFPIDSRLEENTPNERYVTVDTLAEFESGIKELMRNFLDFFVSYGLELGQRNDNNELEKLTQRLQESESSEKLSLRSKRPKT